MKTQSITLQKQFHMFFFILYLIFNILLISTCQKYTSFEKEEDNTNEQNINQDVNQDELPKLPSTESQIQKFSIGLGRIQPNFIPDVFLYNITIPDNAEITASIFLSNDISFLKINNSIIDDFTNSFTYNFSGNTQSITILCTAEDKLTTSEYTFNVHKTENIIFNSNFEEVSGTAPLGWTMKSAGIFTSIFDDSGSSAAFNTLTQAVDGREVLSASILYKEGMDILLTADVLIPHFEKTADVKFSLKLYFFTDEECKIPASKSYKTLNSVTPASGSWETIKLTCRSDELGNDTLYIKASIRACYIAGVGTKDSLHRFNNVRLYMF